MLQKEKNRFINLTGGGSKLIKKSYRQKTSRVSAFLFCVIFFVFLPVGFSGVSKAEANTYYVNSACTSNCDGSMPARGWTTLFSATNPANVPAGSTVEVVTGSGPYYERLIPNVNQDNVIWNFNGAEIRGDIDLNPLVGSGQYSWQLSSDSGHSGYYFLAPTSSIPDTNLAKNDSMENEDYWGNYATISVNERSSARKYSGNYSRHAVVNAGGISQGFAGLKVGTTYRISGYYYIESGALTVFFFSNKPDLTTTGSWQHFQYDIVATSTTNSLKLWYGGSAEFYIDDIKVEELNSESTPVSFLNPWRDIFKNSTSVLSAVVDGTWNASSTKDWTANKWDWGDFDSLGYNTLYVNWIGGDPTGSNIEILAGIDNYALGINVGATGHIFNDAHFIGSNGYLAGVSEATIFNRCVFQYAEEHGIDIGTSTGGNLSGTTVANSKFIDCGHRGINIKTSVNTLNVYNNYFYGCHLMLRNEAINSSVVNFKNNSSYNAIAGSIQWANNTSILNENNNQFHINANSYHGGKKLAFTASGGSNWVTSHSTDVPGNFSVTSPCDGSNFQNCGINPFVDGSGRPLYNSSLIDSGTSISGITTDYLGNHIYGMPDIGAYEYQPPYTIGNDDINVSSPVRIYADGKYRYKNETSGGSDADLTVIPQGGFGAGDYGQWMDIDVDTWHTSTDYYKKWTESSTDHALITNHTVGDLQSDTYYTLSVDGTETATYLSDGSGRINFTYSGGYSTHTFEIGEDVSGPAAFSLLSPADGAVISTPTHAFSWNAAADNASGLSKYQLYLDGVMDKDNIPSGTTSASPSAGLSCGSHTWYVKAIDNNGNSTNSGIFRLDMNCGGAFVSPAKPYVTVANITFSADGKLGTLNLPVDIIQIAISRTSDFADVSWREFDEEKFITIGDTAETLYVKFRTAQGAVSDMMQFGGNPTTQTINDGDIVKTLDNPDIYVIKIKNNKLFKRLLLSPSVFDSYRHLKWENLKTISQELMDKYTTSNLVKETNDPVIYTLTPNGDTGQRRGYTGTYDIDSIYEINATDRDSYRLAV